VVAAERRALATTKSTQVEGQLRLSLSQAERSLNGLVSGNAQQTMSPIRTGVTDARRATATAKTLVRKACGGASS
jgi:hypothetical protein